MPRPSSIAAVSDAFARGRNDYDAARDGVYTKKRRGLHPQGSNADYHYRNERDYLKLLELARDIDRNDMLVGQGVDRVVDNVLQTGVMPDPQTGSSELDDIALADWEAWSTKPFLCHSERRLTWLQLERLVFRAAFLVDGDHLVFPTDQDSLWSVESHRLRTPQGTKRKVVHGLLLNDRDQIEQYWVTKEDVTATQPVKLVNEIEPYDAWDAKGNPLGYFISDPTRTSQRRGISPFTPISKACGLIDDTNFAQLLKLQIASCIAIVRETSGGTGLPPGITGEGELRSTGSTERLLEHIFPGMEVVGKPGEKLTMFSPQLATTESMQFSMLMLNVLAVNLGIPVAVLLLDPSNTNFSGWRGAIDQARQSFRRMVTDYIGQFHVHVWHWRMRLLMARRDKVGQRVRQIIGNDGVDAFGHQWNAKGYGYIEPLKDATANALRMEKLLAAPRILHAEQGGNWFKHIDQTTEDNSYAIEQAIRTRRKLIEKFAKESGMDAELVDKTHWREFLCLTTTQNLSIAINAADHQQQGAANNGN